MSDEKPRGDIYWPTEGGFKWITREEASRLSMTELARRIANDLGWLKPEGQAKVLEEVKLILMDRM